MYETPQHLEERTREDVEKVPSLGLGFLKTRLDRQIHERLFEHFKSNISHFKPEPENDYLLTENKASSPSLIYFDEKFNQRLLNELQPAHEAWSGMPLKKAICYGIRIYQSGSFLYNHIDRISTHVVSSSICIDHRLTSPWPLYIEDNDGRPHEVLIEPGEMLFYESARLKHGRPYPLNGEYSANIFLHYTPVGWNLNIPST